MSSDRDDLMRDEELPDAMASEATPTSVASVAGHPGEAERGRKRRLLLLALLILLLLGLSYVAYYYTMNKRLPVPTIVGTARTKIEPPQFLYAFSGQAKQAMTRPTGITVRGDIVYITDYASRSIRTYTRAGVFRSQFNKVSDGKNTRLSAPTHLAIAPDGTVWVTDRRLKRIYVFQPDGTFIKTFDPGPDLKKSWSPLAITFGKDGTLYVTDVGDSKKHQVLVFSPEGSLKLAFGQTQQVNRIGDALGSFMFPNGLAVEGVGSKAIIYVADGNNRRVQVFKADGTYVRLINTSGTPRGTWLDDKGRLYVADAIAQRVDIYSSKGDPLAQFGEAGVGPGQFAFPNDLALDDRGRIFITDRENNQVQVWGFAAAEIPGVTRVNAANWWLCLLPFPFLLLPLFFRRRRFVVTPDFVDGMIAAELVTEMDRGRWRWIISEADHERFAGVVVDGVALGTLLRAEPYSQTDARQLADRLSIDMDTAGILAMGQRYKVLCTEDVALARMAVMLKVDVYDRSAWLRRFAKRATAREDIS
ncbi:MAG: 6-bladed beta-propeller [Coriobacteriia bacterium]|nr:6-bladed beta-propeller [Coriobacteriia bacterium]